MIDGQWQEGCWAREVRGLPVSRSAPRRGIWSATSRERVVMSDESTLDGIGGRYRSLCCLLDAGSGVSDVVRRLVSVC